MKNLQRRFRQQLGTIVIAETWSPLGDHPFKVSNQQISRGTQVISTSITIAIGTAFTFGIIANRTISRTSTEAIQVLAPKQKFDGVITRRDVRLGPSSLIQICQKIRSDNVSVDCFTTDVDFPVGYDIGRGTVIAHFVLVIIRCDIIDHAFVQGPCIQLTFPFVHNRIAETEGF